MVKAPPNYLVDSSRYNKGTAPKFDLLVIEESILELKFLLEVIRVFIKIHPLGNAYSKRIILQSISNVF